MHKYCKTGSMKLLIVLSYFTAWSLSDDPKLYFEPQQPFNGQFSFDNSLAGPYKPDWNSLDSRPLPSWFDDIKLGIFLHWGVWSVPSFGVHPSSETAFFWRYWNMKDKNVMRFLYENYPPHYAYADFAADFKAEFYDPTEWVDLFASAGARYVVLVTKHHDGFNLWPSNHSYNWNAGFVGPKRDLVGALEKAVRHRGPRFGVYHSMFEWYNPMFLLDQEAKFQTDLFVRSKTLPELYELVNTYKPDLIWSDGDWSASPEYWKSKEFLAWLYNQSPVKDQVVVNDRWGAGTACKHGGYFNCHDKYNPKVLQKHKWENAMTMDRGSWGYRRTIKQGDVLTVKELVSTLVWTISCGGNMLLNVGPTSYGRIPDIFQDRLLGLGKWVGVNSEAIYSSKPWTFQNDTINNNVWYTKRVISGNTFIYGFLLDWPEDDQLIIGSTKTQSSTIITMLGYTRSQIKWETQGSKTVISLPHLNDKTRPCDHAWVFRFANLINA